MTQPLRFAALAVALALGGEARAQEAAPLAVGEAVEGTLASGDAHVYRVALDAGQFVYAEATQRSADVVVEVLGPDGGQVDVMDQTARGPEAVVFTTDAAGLYQLRVTPFAAEAGDYALAVRRVEPIATTPEGMLRQRMAAFDGDDRPGGIVAVIRGGEVVHQQAFGMADLAHGLPITRETVFNIGSVAKQFAGIFFAMKAEEGALSIDDDVRQYVPEIPDFGPTVTLRHLLNHTNGYREVYGILGMQGRRVDGDILERRDAIEVVTRQPALQFEPGTWYLYNSTAYVILTTIAERITGQPYPDWMDEHVFGPLGMDDTTIERVAGEVVPNAATSYTITPHGTYRDDFEAYNYYGATDVYTTVDDLARWLRNFRTSELGGPGVMERMKEPMLYPTGDTLTYTLGIGIDRHLGLERISHGGATGGYRAFLSYYPALDAGVVVLANTGAVQTQSIGNATAASFFADRLPDDAGAAPEAAGGPVGIELQDRLAGAYRVPGFGVMTLTSDGDALAMTSTVGWSTSLLALDDSTVGDGEVRFQVSPAAGRTLFHLRGRGSMPIERVGPVPQAPDLTAYAGRYFSEEVEAFYTLAVEDGRLVVEHRRLGTLPLRPFAADLFGGAWPLREVVFQRDAAGRVTGFLATDGRTIDVAFERIE